MEVHAQDVGTITVPGDLLNLGGMVKNLLLVAFFGAALFFLAQLIIGGISWMGAGGDPKAMEAARNRLTNAIIGILIVASAFAVTLIVTTVLGINIFEVGGITIN